MRQITLSIIVPVFNEEEVLPFFIGEITTVLDKLNCEHEIIFVNDGSSDGTAKFLDTIAAGNKAIKVVTFKENRGQQQAILSGIGAARGKAIVVMDCDLQDPPRVIPFLFEKWKAGDEIVFAKRKKRKDTLTKKVTAYFYYRILNLISGNTIVTDCGDFYLLDKKIKTRLKDEKYLFLRGALSLIGVRKGVVFYERDSRQAGKSKYTWSKMINLGMHGFMLVIKKRYGR